MGARIASGMHTRREGGWLAATAQPQSHGPSRTKGGHPSKQGMASGRLWPLNLQGTTTCHTERQGEGPRDTHEPGWSGVAYH